jgi:DNA-binding response OmpR family regulator
MKNTSWQQKNTPILFIISNNSEIRELWNSFLGKEYEVFAMKVMEFSPFMEKQWPDMVLIDNCDGESSDISLCNTVRRNFIGPLILLVENYRESHLLELYQAGADDCIGKPVSPLIIRAKLKIWSRYTYSNYVTDSDILEIQNWRLIPQMRELYCDSNKPVHLTILEYHLMHILLSRANKTVFADFLVDHLWGKNSSGDAAQLKNLVYRLRRKIEPVPESPRYLLTISGMGYVLKLKKSDKS